MLSNKSFNSPSAVNKIVVAILVCAALGFIDASYLTVSHYFAIPLPCSLVNGCERVTTSVYSTVFGIPLALFGAAYYLAMVLLSVFFLDRRSERAMKILAVLSTAGFLISLGLVSIQLFVLASICLYCMTSALITTIIFLLSIRFFRPLPHEGKENEGNKTQEY
jgi:uncharacterized membrane protein